MGTILHHPKKYNFRLVNGRSLILVSISVVILTSLSIFLQGAPPEHGIFIHSLVTTSIISVGIFLFLAFGLYLGVKLRQPLGKEKSDKKRFRVFSRHDDKVIPVEFLSSDSPEALLAGIIIFVALALAIIFFTWIFMDAMIPLLIAFMVLLYWVFYRSLRQVFKNSRICKGDFRRSAGCALVYTLIYSLWVYGVIVCFHFLLKQ